MLSAVIFCRTDRTVEVVDGPDGSAYSWSTGWNTHTGSTSLESNIGDSQRGAWAAYSAVREAFAWMDAQAGYRRDVVTVSWPDGDWPHSHGDEMHLPSSGDYANAVWDPETIFHEFGHCVQYAMLGDRFPEGDGPDPHYIYSESSPGFAFSEGWAQFLASAISGSPVRESDRTSLESTVYADGAFGYDGDSGDWDGSIVEGAVANVLWDIFDGASAADRPSFSSVGDGVDRQFRALWDTMLENQVESIDDVWASWEGKDAALQAVFYNARIRKDFNPPLNPDSFTSSHDLSVESKDSTVSVTLSGAWDDSGDVAGYSVLWDNSPTGMPDATIDVAGATVTSQPLSSGVDWYLHVRAVDDSGNCALSSYTVGPFRIAPGATPQGSSAQMPWWLPIAAAVFVAAVGTIAVLALVAGSKAKKERQRQAEAMRAQQTYYQYAGPQAYCPQTQYQQGNAQQYSQPGPQAPACQGCGRVDMGAPFCPYCGRRLR
jgi:hypothetical protein